MKIICYLFFVLLSAGLSGQNPEPCNLQKSAASEALKVDQNEMICIAENSDKPYTVFYTLASWCAPCRLHFPDAVELEKTGKVNLFVVLVESEHDKRLGNAVNFIKSKSENVKFGVLKDEIYGTKTGKRNRKLATEITPKHNETIDDYGKFILVDKTGKILYVTNWKDYNKDWQNSKKMLENKIMPLLK
ncbi:MULTISPECIES: TlpA family protein disulfide reductase [unclassified Chryseobacterium]|uniref:TlpA family protein disulfide reductase n=1 Tax=unclassified Chryseobacterium TaxID=2593645 RepID=UPI000A6A9716|nr:MULTISPECIES: hypothetical protein [unclassified Chryseobacterium]